MKSRDIIMSFLHLRANVAFKEDEGIDVRFRNHLADFKSSGYDRGHLAPAADHKSNQRAMEDTFTLSNISPQVGKGFNRDYWARFERFVKQLAKQCEALYVITGPLYLPSRTPAGSYAMTYPLIGQPPQLVAVPTHFFKVVLGEGPGSTGPAFVGAFVMPNQPLEPGTPLTSFAVPVSSLEEVSGLRFFPEYVDDERWYALDVAALGWQRQGREQLAQLPSMTQQLDGMLSSGPIPGGRSLPAPAPPTPFAAPASQGSAGSTGKRRPKKAAATAPPPAPLSEMVLTGPGGRGAKHVCEVVACKLPAEDWFLSSSAAADEHTLPAGAKLKRSQSAQG